MLRSEDLGTMAYGGAPRPVRWLLRGTGPGSARSVIEPPSMLAVDPPVHSRYRRLVTRAFTARAVRALRERTEEIAGSLLDDVDRGAATGPVDLVATYAAQLPVIVICEIMGAPTSMSPQFLQWGDAAATSLDPGLDRRAFRHAQRGIDAQTTVNLLATGITLLDRHPDQRVLLAGRPQLWPNAVDEMLRFDSPVQRTARRASRDTEVLGERFRKGEIVVVLLGAANRDPEVFDEPARFDVTRANAGRHLAFSSGIHHCLGAALARVEGEVALRALFTRFPGLAVVGEPHRRPTSNLRGYDVVRADLAGSPVR
ncbi:MAG TPA: cytochrome P450 [Pseudonocardia sp.]